MLLPDYPDIDAARRRIEPFIHRTPVLTSLSINKICNANLFFKCENFQKAGAFKFRGAANAILSLSPEELSKGVATHSSGNHAQALALAASIKNIKATIIMPDNSPIVKKNAVSGYGAEIIYCKPTLEARESALNKYISDSGAVFIHPYNNFNVICGQGSAAAELMEDSPALDYIICPVGGGGLLSGTLISTNYFSPKTKVIAAEPEGADDAFRSLQKGKIVPSINPQTIADGLLTSLGDMTFEIIRKYIYKIITVSDNSIKQAMRLIYERLKIVVEPSAAVGLSVILEKKIDLSGKNTGIILSGGNVDLEKLQLK